MPLRSSRLSQQQPSATSVIKVVLAGDAGVGKTLLAHQLANPERAADHAAAAERESTVGVDFFSVPVTTRDGLRVTVQLWDTAGQERYRAMSRTTFRGAHAVVVMYDVTDGPSFNSVSNWVDGAREIAPGATVAIVGNKTDLEHMRSVPHGFGASLAERLSHAPSGTAVRHFEISSFTRDQLDAFVCEAVSDAADALVANAAEQAQTRARADSDARKRAEAKKLTTVAKPAPPSRCC